MIVPSYLTPQPSPDSAGRRIGRALSRGSLLHEVLAAHRGARYTVGDHTAEIWSPATSSENFNREGDLTPELFGPPAMHIDVSELHTLWTRLGH